MTGLIEGGVAEFRGIPYAAAPTGALRFRPPQPRAAWSQTLNATQFGSACPQSARLGTPSVDEDCLSLNVYAPLSRQEGRPVLVFIHGGSFNAGSGGVAANGPDYRGNDIAARSGAVVVTVNYRLSILGFLASPALDAENDQGVSSNYGLQDQQEALRWVQRNVARFGGDPGNVTIFGESAGGISVLYHLVSPGCAGLFQRAIIESSDDGASLPLPAAETLEQPVVAALGCGDATDVAACLRALPVEKIVNSGLNVGPLIDGVTVPGQPTDRIAAGSFNKVPVIAGTNRNEGTYFVAVAANAAGRALTDADYDAVSRGRLTETAVVGNAAMEGHTVLEWDKDDVDALGLLKVDILALGMLSCLRRAFDLLRQHRRLDLDLAGVPRDCGATYAMLRRADSLGVFQVESRAQMNMLPRLRPSTFYDLVVQVALVRPGPIQGDMVHPYIRRRWGLEQPEYPKSSAEHGDADEMERVLGRTLGVPLFQEQAMRVAIVAAGFTPEEADDLRRAMATFKYTQGVGVYRDRLVGGMVRRGYDPTLAERVFKQIEGFAPTASRKATPPASRTSPTPRPG